MTPEQVRRIVEEHVERMLRTRSTHEIRQLFAREEARDRELTARLPELVRAEFDRRTEPPAAEE